MRTTFIRCGLFLSFTLLLSVQGLKAQGDILEQYINTGLQNNIVLQQKNLSLERALLALQSARSLFLPTVDFQAGYQTGEGGRSIAIPVGDIVNPVYATLNQLTGTHKFPQIGNSESYFLPRNFLDAKVTTVVPLLNPELKLNRQLQQQQVGLGKTDLDLYKRELVKSIKTAYYQFLSTVTATHIYESALQLAAEAKRTNEKLLASGKSLPAYVLRSESELENIRAQLNDARAERENARMYVNFLLNAGMSGQLDTSYPTGSAPDLARQALAVEGNKREEVLLQEQSLAMQQTGLKLDQAFRVPRINGFVNLGTQAEQFSFSSKSFYYLLGLQAEVPLFHGKRNFHKIKSAELEISSSQKGIEQTSHQLQLSREAARNHLLAALENFEAARLQLEAAASYQRLIERGYREGVNTFIETVDARNQLTAAELKKNLSLLRLLAATAALERENASYPFKS